LVTCIDSILKLFSTYFKQFKLNFNHSFQHFQFVISIVQNNYGRLFLHYFFITTTIHFPQILIHSWKIESMVKFIIKYQERKYNSNKVWSMFLYEFHTTYFLIYNWTYQESVVLKVEIKNENMKNVWFSTPKKTLNFILCPYYNSSNSPSLTLCVKENSIPKLHQDL